MFVFHADAVGRMSDVGDGRCFAAFPQLANSKAVKVYRFLSMCGYMHDFTLIMLNYA